VKSISLYLERFQRYGALKTYNFSGHPVQYRARRCAVHGLRLVFRSFVGQVCTDVIWRRRPLRGSAMLHGRRACVKGLFSSQHLNWTELHLRTSPWTTALEYLHALRTKGSLFSITERIGFRSWSRILAVNLQETWVINPAVGCHYVLPGLHAITPATLKRAATNFAAWWTEAQWVWRVCPRLLPDSVATAIWTPGPSAPESSTLSTRLPSHVEN